MKKYVNSFEVTGFVAVDAEIRQLASSSVARFPPLHRPDGQERQRTEAHLRTGQCGSVAQERERPDAGTPRQGHARNRQGLLQAYRVGRQGDRRDPPACHPRSHRHLHPRP